MKNWFKISVILILGYCLELSGQDTYHFKVIVYKENPIQTISADELSNIFLKKHSRWEDNTKIYPVDLSESSKTRKNLKKYSLNH